MWHALLRDTRFYEHLTACDRDLAESARAQGCACGGRLHQAHYLRKPRGGPPALDASHARRLSFCCERDGCRRRKTPPSLRFLGRRVYFGVVVVLVTAMTQGLTPRRVTKLRADLGVDRHTLARWRRWWREGFVRSELWRVAKARFAPPIAEADLPGSLLERFTTSEPVSGFVSLLRVLAAV